MKAQQNGLLRYNKYNFDITHLTFNLMALERTRAELYSQIEKIYWFINHERLLK